MSLDGLLLIDKPAGWTSHDVVAKARRLCGQRRIGHTGTLDPMATGLLVLCLGQATRLVEYLTTHGKRYTGEITLGARTTTDDAEGEVIERRPVPSITDGDLRDLERRFCGEIEQVPPAFSAIKVEGRRSYAVARGGGEPDLVPRGVRLDRLHLWKTAHDRLGLELECGPGTYVRSLARDIGEALGCGGHLSTLRRERVGRFDVDAAHTLEEVAEHGQGGVAALLRPMDDGLVGLDAVLITTERGRLLRNGAVLKAQTSNWRSARLARIYDADGEFVAVGVVSSDGEIRGRKVFSGSSAKERAVDH